VHPRVRRQDFPQLRLQRLERVTEYEAFLRPVAPPMFFGTDRLARASGPLQDQRQFLRLERLDEVVGRAEAHRLDRPGPGNAGRASPQHPAKNELPARGSAINRGGCEAGA
jgi:hypothetical protein